MTRSLLPRPLSCALLAPALLLAATAGEAHADVPAPVEADTPGWALGASVGLGWVGLGGLVGGLSGDAVAPGVVLERRLGGSWWLLAGLDGSYTDLGDSASRSLHGRVGVRYVVDPDARVTVAPTLALVAGGAVAEQDGANTDGSVSRSESRATSVGAEVGLDVDLRVTAGFALRLHTTLLTASWVSLTSTTDDAESHLEGGTAALGVRPTLAAVFAF